jgi:hypothetical protein
MKPFVCAAASKVLMQQQTKLEEQISSECRLLRLANDRMSAKLYAASLDGLCNGAGITLAVSTAASRSEGREDGRARGSSDGLRAVLDVVTKWQGVMQKYGVKHREGHAMAAKKMTASIAEAVEEAIEAASGGDSNDTVDITSRQQGQEELVQQLDAAKKEAVEARKEAEQAKKKATEARLEAEETAKKAVEEVKKVKQKNSEANREAEEAGKEAEQERRAANETRKEVEEARKEAEAKAKLEAEATARKEAEEKARKEAEEKARKEVEEARKEAEEARKEAEEASREVEEARKEAEEARKEAEEARKEAEEARKEAEEARKEAEEARKEAGGSKMRVAELTEVVVERDRQMARLASVHREDVRAVEVRCKRGVQQTVLGGSHAQAAADAMMKGVGASEALEQALKAKEVEHAKELANQRSAHDAMVASKEAAHLKSVAAVREENVRALESERDSRRALEQKLGRGGGIARMPRTATSPAVSLSGSINKELSESLFDPEGGTLSKPRGWLGACFPACFRRERRHSEDSAPSYHYLSSGEGRQSSTEEEVDEVMANAYEEL